MTAIDTFLENNLAKAPASKKMDILKSTTMLVALEQTPALTLGQLHLTLLNDTSEMMDLLNMLIVDEWRYVDVYAGMVTTLAAVRNYREQLRGTFPAKTISATALDTGDADVKSLYYLWKGVPTNARLQSVISSLLIRGSGLNTAQFGEFCTLITSALTVDQLYQYLQTIWPANIYPIRYFNFTYESDTASANIDSAWVFVISVAQSVMSQIENQTDVPNFCA